MTLDLTPGPVLAAPVWYEPTLRPDWLLVPPREGAPHVLAACEPFEASTMSVDDILLRRGLPLYLAEALSFTMNASVSSATRSWDWERDGALAEGGLLVLTSVEDDDEDRMVRVTVCDAEGRSLEVVERPVPDDASFAEVCSMLPNLVSAALRGHGLSGVWASVWQPPPAHHAARYVAGQWLCYRLRTPDVYPAPGQSPDTFTERREEVTAVLSTLADLATRMGSTFPAALFAAGLVAARANGCDVYAKLHLEASSLFRRPSEPKDPLYRLAVLVFKVFEEQVLYDQHVRALGTGDEVLSRWLARTKAL